MTVSTTGKQNSHFFLTLPGTVVGRTDRIESVKMRRFSVIGPDEGRKVSILSTANCLLALSDGRRRDNWR